MGRGHHEGPPLPNAFSFGPPHPPPPASPPRVNALAFWNRKPHGTDGDCALFGFHAAAPPDLSFRPNAPSAWHFNLSTDCANVNLAVPWTRFALCDDGSLAIAWVQGAAGNLTLTALDGQTGALKWRKEVPCGATPDACQYFLSYGAELTGDGRFVVYDEGVEGDGSAHKLHVLNAADGSPRGPLILSPGAVPARLSHSGEFAFTSSDGGAGGAPPTGEFAVWQWSQAAGRYEAIQGVGKPPLDSHGNGWVVAQYAFSFDAATATTLLGVAWFDATLLGPSVAAIFNASNPGGGALSSAHTEPLPGSDLANAGAVLDCAGSICAAGFFTQRVGGPQPTLVVLDAGGGVWNYTTPGSVDAVSVVAQPGALGSYYVLATGCASVGVCTEPGGDLVGVRITVGQGKDEEVAGEVAGEGEVPNTTLSPASLYFAPYSWSIDAAAPCASAPGSLLRAFFTNTTTATLLLAGADAEASPLLAWSIDGGVYSLARASDGSGAPSQPLLLASGLNPRANHTLRVILESSNESKDRWLRKPLAEGGNEFVCVEGLALDPGGVALPSALRPKRMLVFGDSITEGTAALRMAFGPGGPGPGPTHGGWGCAQSDVYHNSALHSWASHVADALNAEISAAAFAAQGYATRNSLNYGNVPPFFTPGDPAASAWAWVFANASRLPALAAQPPHYVFNALGFNDQVVPPAQLTLAVAGSLAAMRTAVGPRALLFQVLPFGGEMRDSNATRNALLGGFADYKASAVGAADGCALILDTFPLAQEGLQGWPAPTAFSCEGTHPNVLGHARVGAMVAAEAARLLGTVAGRCG